VATLITYTTGQVASMAGVSQQTVIRAVDREEIKGAFRVPGSKFRRIPSDSVRTWFREQKIPTLALDASDIRKRTDKTRSSLKSVSGTPQNLAELEYAIKSFKLEYTNLQPSLIIVRFPSELASDLMNNLVGAELQMVQETLEAKGRSQFLQIGGISTVFVATPVTEFLIL
jgi:hypothetical protein